MYQQYQLKNGARVILAPQHETQAVTAMVAFSVGSRYETKKINGVSHFLEHLFFKGTAKRPNTLAISRDLDRYGANYNAYTGKDMTAYYVQIAAEHLPLALDIISDMLFNSLFEAKELEREKNVIVEEINMYEDNPLMYVEDLLEQQIYTSNTLGWEIAGTRETVRGMTRSALINYKNHYYRPANMVIGLAGRLPDNVKDQIKAYFDRPWQYQKNKLKTYAPCRLTKQPPRVKIKYKDTEQAQLAMGFNGLPYNHRDLPALNLLNVILGGNMSSRLFISVRERRGLAYFVRASTTNYQDTGNTMIQAGLDKNRLPDAIKVILAELKKAKAKGVTKKELSDAKDFLRGKLILSLEDSGQVAEWYVKQATLTNKIYTPVERLAKYDQVTIADVQRLAKQTFHPHAISLALIGPFEDGEKFKKLLKL